MNKAFIFDMDGVIIDSETVWEKYDKKYFSSVLGKKGYLRIKNKLIGSSRDAIFDEASKIGIKITKKQFIEEYDQVAMKVYQKSKISRDIDILIEKLISYNFKIGLLTASPLLWIDQVLPRLKNKSAFSEIISLPKRKDLRPKPYPDGYLEIINKLGSSPKKTIILEDSNRGIKAGIASKAFTICLTENLPNGYKAKGADLFLDNLKEVIQFIEKYE